MNVKQFNEHIAKGNIALCIDAFEELKEENRELLVGVSNLEEKVDALEYDVKRLEEEVEELEVNVMEDNEDVSLPWSQALELLDLNRYYIDPLELFEWIDKRAVIY